jgi:hypothetical protein
VWIGLSCTVEAASAHSINLRIHVMSALSQLAAEIAADTATAAAAAPLTQAPDDASSASDVSALTPAPRPSDSGLSSSAAAATSAPDYSNDDSHDASSCSPCLSSTPPPFVAPDMLDSSPPVCLTVMHRSEQQEYREQLMLAPGLYACWRMRRMVTMYSSSARYQFHTYLLGGRVTQFELVHAYVGLHREVSCLYTVLGCGVVFRESPLQTPLVHFREDGQELRSVDGALAWNSIHRHFDLTFMPYLLLATAKSVSS